MRVKVLRHRRVFRGRVFDVEQDRVRMPNGREVTLDLVRHPGSVVMIPQPSQRHVILIRQYRYAIRQWIWELPAGSLEPGEAPRTAARRECREEIGLSPRRLTRVATLYPTPGFCDELMIFYRCQDLVTPTGAVALDPDEQIEPRVFTLKAARELIVTGDILDMKTVLGLRLVGSRA